RLKVWKTYPTWRFRQAASSSSFRFAMSVSPMMTAPSDGRSIPAMMLRRVVLPDPEGPIRARNSPSGTSRLTSDRGMTRAEPRWWIFDRCSIRTMGLPTTRSLLRANGLPVRQRGRLADHDRLAAVEAPYDLDLPANLRAQRHAPLDHLAVDHDVH